MKMNNQKFYYVYRENGIRGIRLLGSELVIWDDQLKDFNKIVELLKKERLLDKGEK